jgi:sterol desaturase/sphingolipid hydroxylase (fatty acid hydroxylase superfamily)
MKSFMKNLLQVTFGFFYSLKTSFVKLSVFIFGVCLLGYFCSVFFNLVEGIYHEELNIVNSFDFKSFNPNGILILAIVSACLWLEAVLLGWDDSSLKKILNQPNNSLKADIFYFFLICAGITPVLGFLCSLGVGYALNESIKNNLNLNLLKDSNLVIQFFVVILFNSFIFYWHHRFFHSKYLWRFHEIHHAAEHFNLITNFRNHPIDIAVRTAFYTLPAAVFGINPFVIMIYSGISGVITCFQHSEFDWKMPFVEKYLIIGSNGHRVHHGQADEYVDKNFGIFVFWDWVFGTYQSPPASHIPIGVKDSMGIHNSKRPLFDLIKVTNFGFKELGSHICAIFKK